MTIGLSILPFVIKVPKLEQIIDIDYMIDNYPFSIQDGSHKIHFFYISTSDGGDFPRIIEIALFHIFQSGDLINFTYKYI